MVAEDVGRLDWLDGRAVLGLALCLVGAGAALRIYLLLASLPGGGVAAFAELLQVLGMLLAGYVMIPAAVAHRVPATMRVYFGSSYAILVLIELAVIGGGKNGLLSFFGV